MMLVHSFLQALGLSPQGNQTLTQSEKPCYALTQGKLVWSQVESSAACATSGSSLIFRMGSFLEIGSGMQIGVRRSVSCE